MYWCKNINNSKAVFSFPKRGWITCQSVLILFMLISFFPACTPDNIQDGAGAKYFNLKNYFKSQVAQLNKLNRPLLKTVTHNKVSESKTVTIKNWDAELSLFIASDINKPAWKDSYIVQDTGDALIYIAKTPDLKTRRIVIDKKGGKIRWIYIINHTKNMLYQTSEWLSYFPDSAYVIQKYQKVRLLGANNNRISGKFN
jgi:hypothetical protein